MKQTLSARILCLLLVMVFAMPTTLAHADIITSNGGFVPAYSSKSVDSRLPKDTPVSAEAKNEDGWYQVAYIDGGMCYVRASDLTVQNPDATATPSPSPTAAPTATAAPTPTLAPGQTAVPTAKPTATPELIMGVKDNSFTGNVLQYKVPAGGLALYARVGDETSQVDIAKEGVTLTLTQVSGTETWYSTYQGGVTYYVPVSILYAKDSSGTGKNVKYNTNIRSVVIGDNGAKYYPRLITKGTAAGKVDTSSGVAGTLEPGERINAKYVNDKGLALEYVVAGVTYYIDPADIHAGRSSTAEVGDKDSVDLISQITLPNISINLYPVKDSDQHITISGGITVYGIKESTDWYKVEYLDKIYYIKTTDLEAQKRITVGSTVNNYADTSGSDAQPLPAGTYNAMGVGNGWYKILDGLYAGRYMRESDVKSGYLLTLPWKTAFYSAPGGEYAGRVENESGQQCEGFSYDDSWYQVYLDGATFYVRKSDLTSGTNVRIKPAVGTYHYNDMLLNDAQQITDVQTYVATKVVNENNNAFYRFELAGGAVRYIQISDYSAANGDPEVPLDFLSEELGNYEIDTALEISQVAYNQTLLKDSYYVTAGVNGASYYASPKRDAKKPYANRVGVIGAGESFLATPYNAEWYTYVINTGASATSYKVYYVNRNDVAGQVATSSMSAIKAYLVREETPLYTTQDESGPSTVGTFDISVPYTVTPINNNWYSILYNGVQYYITAGSLDQTKDTTPVPVTKEGATYKITVGTGGARLYRDAECTAGILTLEPGTVLEGKKYSSSLYLVSLGDTQYYMSFRDVGSILSADDAGAAVTLNPEDISSILKGETVDTFANPVLSYTVPTGGLWLYHDEDGTKPALAIDAGVTLKLTADTYRDDVYVTWYGGARYYVLLSTIIAKGGEMKTGVTFSVQLSGNAQKKIALYSDDALKKPVKQTLEGGRRYNVQIAKTNTKTGAVTVYKTKIGETWYYFNAENVKGNSESMGTLDSNQNANMMREFTFTAPSTFVLYMNPQMDSPSKQFHVNDGDISLTLYGVTYDDLWYKVIHEGGTWYLRKVDYTGADKYLSITEGEFTSTFTVVIGRTGARLYSAPSTNEVATTISGKKYAALEQNYVGYDLPAGETVLCSRYNDGWYSITKELESGWGVRQYYFRNGSTANASAVDAVSSIILTIDANSVLITLYSAMSRSASTALSLPTGSSVQLRRVDNDWYSFFYKGETYYVNSGDIPTGAMEKSTPIGSTTIGKTYKVTLGTTDGKETKIDYYNDSLLMQKVGQVSSGTVVTGTKLYDETFERIVYAIDLDGATRYVEEKYITGVSGGDETTEPKETQDDGTGVTPDPGASSQEIKVGDTFTQNLPADTKLYLEMDTNSAYQTLVAAGNYQVEKVSDTWYALVYNTVRSYVLSTIIEQSKSTSTDGSDIQISESFTYTLKVAVNLYARAQDNSTVLGTLKIGDIVRLKKISASWYEYTSNTTTAYIKDTELFGKTTNSNAGKTTDGTGIITALLLISPASGTVNLRREASTRGVVLARMPKGTQVVNNGYEKDASGNLWYKIVYEKQSGYVSGEFVSPVGTVSENNDPVVDPSQDVGRTLSVNVAEVNIRSGPGQSHSVLGKLNKGDNISPTGYSNGDDGLVWYKFLFGGQVAYIRYDYLDGSIVSTEELTGNVAVRSGGTNLRKGAGESFAATRQLNRDEIVTITGTGTDANNVLWYRVTIDGETGYVRADLVRKLTIDEGNSLVSDILKNYKELRHGDTGTEVLALQRQLINIGYLVSGQDDGTYGVTTTTAVTNFQKANGLTQTGVATPATQAAIFNTSSIATGSTSALDWFSAGRTLLEANRNIQIFDIKTRITWNARYVEGANHADVVPATAADAQKLKANNITGSYERRPVIATVAGQQFAGSMYAVGHGSTNFVNFFSGVMCLHFTGSKTHGSSNVDADHQKAIQEALDYAVSGGN